MATTDGAPDTRQGQGRAARGGLTATAPDHARRPYSSARRRQQAEDTRASVVAAATALFGERGWSATGMRDVAKEAGVSVETVYSNFGSKSELLLTAIDVGVVGDTATVPLADRPEFAALAEGGLDHRVAAAARMVTRINRRILGLRNALTEAAGSDPLLRAKLMELETRRRANTLEAMELVFGRRVTDDVLDRVWIVTGVDAFTLLTLAGGRTVEDYEQWLAATVRALVEQS
jgi:AcrR family transcriptional regulator